MRPPRARPRATVPPGRRAAEGPSRPGPRAQGGHFMKSVVVARAPAEQGALGGVRVFGTRRGRRAAAAEPTRHRTRDQRRAVVAATQSLRCVLALPRRCGDARVWVRSLRSVRSTDRDRSMEERRMRAKIHDDVCASDPDDARGEDYDNGPIESHAPSARATTTKKHARDVQSIDLARAV